MYKNATGGQVIDATPQSPPLEADDPGVPEKGEFEINLATQVDYSRDERTFDFFFIDANYGLLPRFFGHELPTQLKFEFPIAGVKETGVPFKAGTGPAQVGLKFNFYDNDHTGLSASFYPQIEFALPRTDAVAKNLVNPGQTLIMPLLFKQELKYVTLVANGAVNVPIHDPGRVTTGTWVVGIGRAITSYTALVGEIRFESSFDFKQDRLVVLNFGVMRRLQDNIILYANIGRSLYTDDPSARTFVGVGVKFLLSLKEKKTQ